MPIDFPTGPTLNQTYTYSGRTWSWNGEGWALVTTGIVTTATTATNLAGGSAGTVPYQSAAGTTAMLAAGTAGQALVSAGAAAPAWTTLTMENIPDAVFKRSVSAATTANITLSGTQTIDGIAVVAGNRVLVKDQTTTSQNGIYVAAAGAWTRATDADTASEIAGGVVNVDAGTTNGGRLFKTAFRSTDTLGTTAMTWVALATTGIEQTFTRAQRGAITALTSAATVTPDFATSNNFSLTLAQSLTLANPTNLVAGQSGAIIITQAAAGGPFTVAYGTAWKFPDGIAPSKNTTASSVCVIAYLVESASRITARMLNDVR